MEVDDALIDNLSDLACLEFNKEEKEGIRKDLQRMVSFVEKLSELDLAGVNPVLQMSEETDVFRKDLVLESPERAALLANAPDADQSYFKVPKVIKNPSA